MKKFIIAFEGHNGVGKSTIINKLNKIMKENNLNSEEFYGVDKDSLNNGLKEKFIMYAEWYPSALHFLAGSMELKRKLQEIKIDISLIDRSFWSTLAVHWDRGEKEREKILSIIRDGKEFLPIPNIIFLLEASYETCATRIGFKKEDIDKKNDSIVDRDYYRKEIEFYGWLKDNIYYDTVLKSINTENKSAEEIAYECFKVLTELEILKK